MPSKEYYWKNPEKHRAATRAYAMANPEWKRESNRAQIAEARKKDPARFKAINNRSRKKNQAKRQADTFAWVQRHPGYYMLKNAQYRAKRLGLPFDLTLEDLVIPAVCPVIGIPIADYSGQGRQGFKPDSPSLDRLVPQLGYVKSNVRVISNRANSLKGDGTLAEMRAVVAYMEREGLGGPP